MQNIEHDIKKYDQYFITKNYKNKNMYKVFRHTFDIMSFI